MVLYQKKLDENVVADVQAAYYKLMARHNMIQEVMSTSEKANNEFMEIYTKLYEDAYTEHQSMFADIAECVPESLSKDHNMQISVNFKNNTLEVRQLCDCDIEKEMSELGFEKY